MTTSPNRPYVPELDQLRGFAALLVFFYHGFHLIGARLTYGVAFDPAQHWVIARDPLISAIAEGHSGVGLFIVLSGFVLSLGAVGRKISYGRFLLARILRIYPVLIACWIATFAGRQTDLASMIATLLPLSIGDSMHGYFSAMFWAVAVEFQCYLVFPFLMLFSNKMGLRILLQVIAVAVVFRCLMVFADGENARDISYWSVAGRIDQFCLGMIAARLYLIHGGNNKITGVLFIPAALAILLGLWAFNHAGGWPVVSNWKIIWPTIEGVAWALFLLCYLRAGRVLPRLMSRPLGRLGEISYSLYMVHFVVLNLCIAMNLYIRMTGVPYYDALLTTGLIALPIALLVSVLLYATIEQPFLQLRPKYVA